MAVEISLCIVLPGAGCKKSMCGRPEEKERRDPVPLFIHTVILEFAYLVWSWI